MRKLVFASHNEGKVKEMRRLFGTEYEIVSLNDLGITEDIPETADTLIGNATIKARYVKFKYGLDCFADDSGLFVDALGGKPGVHTARYSGEGNSPDQHMDLLLENMKGVTNRKAAFQSVVLLMIDQEVFVYPGTLGGTITTEKLGNNGFGYDPIFIPDGYSVTLAQLTDEEKMNFGCRFEAINKMREDIRKLDAKQINK